MDNEKEIEINRFISQIPTHMNKLWSLITKMTNLRYQLLIYKLLKRGLITTVDLSVATNLSRERLYKIVDDVDKTIKSFKEDLYENTNN